MHSNPAFTKDIWAAEEQHSAFLDGLKEFGRNWKIPTLVPMCKFRIMLKSILQSWQTMKLVTAIQSVKAPTPPANSSGNKTVLHGKNVTDMIGRTYPHQLIHSIVYECCWKLNQFCFHPTAKNISNSHISKRKW
jgi:hypothetical protein